MALSHFPLPVGVRRRVSGRKKCAKRRARRARRRGGGGFVRSLFASGNVTRSLARRPYLIPLSLSLSLSLLAQAQPKLPNLLGPSAIWDGLPARPSLLPPLLRGCPTCPSVQAAAVARQRTKKQKERHGRGRREGRADGRTDDRQVPRLPILNCALLLRSIHATVASATAKA